MSDTREEGRDLAEEFVPATTLETDRLAEAEARSTIAAEPAVVQKVEVAEPIAAELEPGRGDGRLPSDSEEVRAPSPMTAEASERDPWDGLRLDLPADTSPEELASVWFALGAEAKAAALARDIAGPEPARSVEAAEQAREPMTVDAIERDPMNALRLGLPREMSPELAALVVETTAQLRDRFGTAAQHLDDAADTLRGVSGEVSRHISETAEMVLEVADDAQLRMQRVRDDFGLTDPPRQRQTVLQTPIRDLQETIAAQIDAAQHVVDNWSSGDLAGAVNGLEEATEAARATLRAISSETPSLDGRESDLLTPISAGMATAELPSRPEVRRRDEEAAFDRRRAEAPAVEREPMTLEAIERDPMNAVTLNLPPDASKELIGAVADAAYDVRAEARMQLSAGRDDAERWRDIARTADDRHETAVYQLDQIAEREAWQASAFSRETIETDPWTAVYLPIPENADLDLLREARAMARELQLSTDGREHSEPWLDELSLGPKLNRENYTREGNFEAATARRDELSERLELARSAEPERQPAVSIEDIGLLQPEVETRGPRDSGFLSGDLATNRLAEHAARVMDLILGVLLIVPEPELTPQQVHDLTRANAERDEERALDLAAREQDADLVAANWTINHNRSPVHSGAGDEVRRGESVYDLYPGLTRHDEGAEHAAEVERAFYDTGIERER